MRAIPTITQETLAKMVGTTRSRVNLFLKRFERLGFIAYKDGLTVHGSLLTVVTSGYPHTRAGREPTPRQIASRLSVHCDTADEIARAKAILAGTSAIDVASTGEAHVGSSHATSPVIA